MGRAGPSAVLPCKRSTRRTHHCRFHREGGSSLRLAKSSSPSISQPLASSCRETKTERARPMDNGEQRDHCAGGSSLRFTDCQYLFRILANSRHASRLRRDSQQSGPMASVSDAYANRAPSRLASPSQAACAQLTFNATTSTLLPLFSSMQIYPRLAHLLPRILLRRALLAVLGPAKASACNTRIEGDSPTSISSSTTVVSLADRPSSDEPIGHSIGRRAGAVRAAPRGPCTASLRRPRGEARPLRRRTTAESRTPPRRGLAPSGWLARRARRRRAP